MRRFGIDISKWQKGFDFDRAKSEGVEFIILRGAYSFSGDSCFEDFYKTCKKKGIPVGVYHYSMAQTVQDAKNEARLMLSILKGKKLEYPVYLDVEDQIQKSLGKDTLTAIIKTYCDTLQAAGYYVGIYSTYYYLRDYTHIKKLCKYDKWIAQWNTRCTSPIPYGMWQFGGETNKIRSNKIAGVTCDQDYAYFDYPSIMRKSGLNGFKNSDDTNTPPVEEKPLKSVSEVAKEVIDGKWGNGAGRKARLTAAGYNYDDVQEKVNELCKNKKTVDQLAREVIAGQWGTGLNRKQILTAAGYDYNAVQKRVNELL